ncbi:MAG TPA: branched-chain amino acid ABC transporter permease [Anaerovoracaceae bacterium]|nr:branched-chain amino acid ABC transporter permease [Anaerovoracaceae bacterium]
MSSYAITIIVNIEIFALLALSLDLIIGRAGQSMLGMAAFFGIGAYSSAILTNAGVNFWISLFLALIITGLCGLLVGIISLRLRDDFLAITTIGINFVIVALFQNMEFFGGSLGMSSKPPTLFGTPMTAIHYAVLLFILVILFVMMIWKMEHSWFGLALASIKDDEGAAASFGIDVAKYKILIFVIGTALAGFIGGIFAHRMVYIFSSDFAFTESITIISMVVVGGIGTIRGPIFGAILLGAAPELLRFADDYRLLVYGLIIVLMMRFQPQGLIGEDSFLVNSFQKYIAPKFKKNAPKASKEGGAQNE